MDTKRLYVDFHVLQTVPPSCVNRDDTGSPKTAVYGGAVRARVSSQAWKHAMRVMFTGEMSDAVETGYRTKKGTVVLRAYLVRRSRSGRGEDNVGKVEYSVVFFDYLLLEGERFLIVSVVVAGGKRIVSDILKPIDF